MKSLSPDHFWGTYLQPPSSCQRLFAVEQIYSPAGWLTFALQLHRRKCFLFWPLYILVVQAWSWLCRKVNAAAGAAEHGEKWFSTQTQPAFRPHSNHTLWNSKGKPKQQVQFIFNSKFMVMPTLHKSMFSLTNFDLGVYDCCYCVPTQWRTWKRRNTGSTWSLFYLFTAALVYTV